MTNNLKAQVSSFIILAVAGDTVKPVFEYPQTQKWPPKVLSIDFMATRGRFSKKLT